MNIASTQKTGRLTANRRGTTLTEIVVSCVLLSGLVMAALPMTVRIARQRLVHREMMVAQNELINQMERLSLVSPDEVGNLAVTISDAHQSILHNAELKLDVGGTQGGMKRVQLKLAWTNRLGNRMQPQTLSMWIPSVDQPGEAEATE